MVARSVAVEGGGGEGGGGWGDGVSVRVTAVCVIPGCVWVGLGGRERLLQLSPSSA